MEKEKYLLLKGRLIGMSEEFTFDVDEKSIENFKKAINYDELEARHQRFMNGTETEDDLINGIYHYRIQNDNGLDLDVVEFKYYQKILDLYNKEKEKNKELYNLIYQKLKLNIIENGMSQNDYISKDKIRKFIEEETHKGTYEFKSISAKRLQELLEEE